MSAVLEWPIALVSFNPIVGDLEGNLDRSIEYVQRAVEQGAELVVFPELSLLGYPPQDLLLRPSFAEQTAKQLDALHAELKAKPLFKDIAVIVGTALSNPNKNGNPMINAAVFLHGERREVRAKTLIPHYGVFNENRYFASALQLDASFRSPVLWKDRKLGIVVCEDSWYDTVRYERRLYNVNPAQELVDAGAECIINLSASPYRIGKKADRRAEMLRNARDTGKPLFYVNQCGANDEILFDGDAFVATPKEAFLGDDVSFQERVLLAKATLATASKQDDRAELAELSSALQTGIRDYVTKNGFSSVMLGLSGGIDSALVATLAAKALGPERVHAYTLPGKYSSVGSLEDSDELGRLQGIRVRSVPIKFLQSTLDMALKPIFAGAAEDVTEENIQARLRGVILMAISNKFGHLLLATGNKSELAVGYSTLYGDMCGALSPIGDLYKTKVYRLAQFLNEEKLVIPNAIITKAPSAELRPNQTDQDSLPEYDLLDCMLEGLIERDGNVEECLAWMQAQGKVAERSEVERIACLLGKAEYKRKQYSPILRTSTRAFGIGRRYPITAAQPVFH